MVHECEANIKVSFRLGGTVVGGLENESTVDYSRNAVVKTLTFSPEAREPYGSEADYAEQKITVYLKHTSTSDI